MLKLQECLKIQIIVLDKVADKHSVKTGDIVTYTLSIKNTGNVDMKDVILTDKVSHQNF